MFRLRIPVNSCKMPVIHRKLYDPTHHPSTAVVFTRTGCLFFSPMVPFLHRKNVLLFSFCCFSLISLWLRKEGDQKNNGEIKKSTSFVKSVWSLFPSVTALIAHGEVIVVGSFIRGYCTQSVQLWKKKIPLFVKLQPEGQTKPIRWWNGAPSLCRHLQGGHSSLEGEMRVGWIFSNWFFFS